MKDRKQNSKPDTWHESHSVDLATVCWSIIRNGLSGRITVKKPFVMKGNRKKKLRYAILHWKLTETQWQLMEWWTQVCNVLFKILSVHVDEVRREVQQWVSTAKCWTMVEALAALQPVVLGILSRIYGITNAEKYHLIMINHLVPYKQPLISNVLIFQHDNPIYTVNALKAYLNRKTWLNRLLSSFELFLTYILHLHVCFLGSNRCYSCLLFPICLAKYKKKQAQDLCTVLYMERENTHLKFKVKASAINWTLFKLYR